MSDPAIDPRAACETDAVGAGAAVGPFAYVGAGASLGARCQVAPHAFVGAGAALADDVVVGPQATVLAGVRVGRQARVEAGAVVVSDVPAHAIVAGNPAAITGYVDAASTESPRAVLSGGSQRLIELPQFDDLRGQLTVLEFGQHLPFTPQRCFVVTGVPNQRVRGEHAHKHCEQALVCLAGSCAVVLDDGTTREEVRLDQPRYALHIPTMVWASQYRYSQDAVVMVLASRPYEPEDYIRDYEEFLRLREASA